MAEEIILNLENNVIYEEQKSSYKTIKEWREDERPREKLEKHGAAALTDSELLAILINTGKTNLSALDIAKNMLDTFSTVSGIAERSFAELTNIKGIGPAKAITLAAAFELGKRSQIEAFDPIGQIYSPDQIAQYYIPKFRHLKKEVFRVLLLNSSNKILREVVVTEGTLNSSLVHPREVFNPAIAERAAAVILMHNHPSGNAKASQEDIEVTRKLKQAGEFIEIKVLDHIIIAGSSFISFTREGLL